jgi:hypothetical protein
LTVTVRPLAALKVAVKVAAVVPVLPSATVMSPTASVGAASSSVIVPTPVPSRIVALLAPDRFKV